MPPKRANTWASLRVTQLTNVVGVELVHTPHRQSSDRPQQPLGERTDERELSWVEIVDQARVEANVRVNNEGDGEQAIEDWLGSAVRQRGSIGI